METIELTIDGLDVTDEVEYSEVDGLATDGALLDVVVVVVEVARDMVVLGADNVVVEVERVVVVPGADDVVDKTVIEVNCVVQLVVSL